MSEEVQLAQSLAAGPVSLELFGDQHTEGLRSACAQDTEIWDIYPHSMLGEHFDAVMERRKQLKDWVMFSVCQSGEVVGCTNYINADPVQGVVEIGGTYIAPSVRGTGFNRAMKKLLIEHAFACGYRRIEFRVDTRNMRSMAAVLKLGAKHEGILRKNRITWTGYVRDTAIFGLFADEWAG